MKEKRTMRRSPATASPSKIDWARFDAMTDADIEAAIKSDREAAPLLTPAWLDKAKLVQPPQKEMISIRLDNDLLEHFRSQERWQTRINAILRMVMEDEKVERPLTPVESAARSIDNEGFLSPHLARWIRKHRAENATWFALAENLNRTGQRILNNAQVVSDKGTADPRLLAILLLIRTLSNFQGAILMTERGMVVEARTLAQCCFENTFCLGALLKGEAEFVNEMLYGELAHRKGTANWILSKRERLQRGGPNAMQRLRKYVDRMNATWETLSPLKFQQAAERGGLGDMYLFYRVLSGDAAHPSVSSLNRYIEPDERRQELRNLRWGPDCDPLGVPETLNYACLAMIGACVAVTELVGDTAGNREVAVHADIYQKLNGINMHVRAGGGPGTNRDRRGNRPRDCDNTNER